MKRGLLLLVVVLAAVLPAAAQPNVVQPDGWLQGARLMFDFKFQNQFLFLMLNPTKVSDPTAPYGMVSTFELALYCADATGITFRVEPTRITVPNDPNLFSVSDDLGWAGLRLPPVAVFDAVSGTETLVEINIEWYAFNTTIDLEAGGYGRAARVFGTVTAPGCSIPFLYSPYSNTFAEIFSTRIPVPRY